MAAVANIPSEVQLMNKATTATIESLHTENNEGPMFLVLSRGKGIVDVELRDPHTDDLVYRIRDTGRGSMSKKPDYEIFRQVNTGDLFVGSIRFGRTSTEIHMPLTDTKLKGYEKIKLQHLQGGAKDFVWKVVKSKRKVMKDRWIETNDDGKSELMTKEEVIVLQLVEAGDESRDPACVVRLINTQPTGRFEIWQKDALINQGGNWNALDELVVSAYANMEKEKRDLMSGMDPSSWRGAAFAA